MINSDLYVEVLISPSTIKFSISGKRAADRPIETQSMPTATGGENNDNNMSGLNSGNMLDGGASSAMKNTDLTEGIYEDVSSDLARERGSGEEYRSLLPGNQGGMLDKLGSFPARTLGSDAKHHNVPHSTLDPGSSNSTKSTEFASNLYEDARKVTGGVKSASTNFNTGVHNNSSSLPTTGGGVFNMVKESVSGAFGGRNSKPGSESAMDAGASSAIRNTDLTDGIYEDTKNGIESVKGATARQ